MTPDDSLLAKYSRSGDPMAFSEICRRYRNLVFAAARRIVGNHHDAEDVAQSVFVELAAKASNVRESLPGWLHRRATTSALNHKRAIGRRARQERQSLEHSTPRSDLPSWDQIGPAVDAAIDKLPEEQRQYVILYYLQGLSQDEVAQVFNVSRATAARKVREGILLLREHIAGASVLPASVLSFMLKRNALSTAPSSLTVSLVKIGMAGVGVKRPEPQRIRFSLPPKTCAFPNALKWLVPLLLIGGATVAVCQLSYWPKRHSRPLPALNPFDQLRSAYLPYLAQNDPVGFPLKVRTAAESPYGLWCADQDLFWNWLKTQAPDWINDVAAYAPCQLDPDASDLGLFGTDERVDEIVAAVGDNSELARVPVQAELLQSAVMLRETALLNHLNLSSKDREVLDHTLATAYRSGFSMQDFEVVSEFLQFDPSLGRVVRKPLDQMSSLQIDADGTARLVSNRKGNGGSKVSLCSADEWGREFQEALNHSSGDETSPDNLNLAAITVRHAYEELNHNRWTSRGQQHFLVQIAPVSRLPSTLLELVEWLPPASIRCGIGDSFPAADKSSLAGARPHPSVVVRGESFVIREPLPRRALVRLENVQIKEQLFALARADGALLGHSHFRDPNASGLINRVNLTLCDRITDLANAYEEYHLSAYDALQADPRTHAAIEQSKGSLGQ